MRIVTLYRSGYRNGYREGEAGVVEDGSLPRVGGGPGRGCGRWQPPAGSFAAVWQQQVAEEADCRGGWDDDLRATQARLARWTHEASLRCAEEVHAHRLGHLPDLSRYPELRGMDQYLDDYYHGYADGAGISFPEALLQTYWYDVKALAMGRAAGQPPDRAGQPPDGTGQPPNRVRGAIPGCSELLMARTPYGPIVGQGCDDWPPQYPPDAFTAPLRPSPPEELVLYVYEGDEGYARLGRANEKGLLGLITGGGAAYEYEEPSDEIFPAPVGEFVLRYCGRVAEAVEFCQRYEAFLLPCNGIIADLYGEAVMFESSRRRFVPRPLDERGLGYTTMCGCENPELRARCDTTSPAWSLYEHRLAGIRRIFAEAEALGPEVMWAALLHHEPGGPMCEHEDNRPFPHLGLTTNSCVTLVQQGVEWRRQVWRDGERWHYCCEAEPVRGTFAVLWKGREEEGGGGKGREEDGGGGKRTEGDGRGWKGTEGEAFRERKVGHRDTETRR